MTALIFILIIIMAEACLGVYAAARAWSHLPARCFLVHTVGVAIYGLGVVLGPRANDVDAAWATLLLSFVGLIMLEIGIVAMLAALFVPQWWAGRQVIRWILLPYALIGGLLIIDLVFRLNIFVEAIHVESGKGYALAGREPGNSIITALFYLSWLLPQAILWYTFARQRVQRPIIGAFAVSLVLAALGGWLFGAVLQIPELSALVALPVLLVLAYAVFSTRLYTPNDVAVGLALGAISEAVAIYDQSGRCIYSNPQAQAAGFLVDEVLTSLVSDDASVQLRALADTATLAQDVHATVVINHRQLACSRAPVRDRRGQLRGAILLGRDVTELEARSTELAQERARLATTVQELAQEQAQRVALAATVRILALPVIPILEGVVVLPLIGDFDISRAREFTGILLQAIERERAQLALIDITGVPILDTAGALALVKATEAAALLGARCMLVGIRPEIAQALVSLGVSFGNLSTAASLQQGLSNALSARSLTA